MPGWQSEVQAERLREKLSNAQALVNKLADSLAEVEAETLGDKLSVRRHWTTRWVTL